MRHSSRYNPEQRLGWNVSYDQMPLPQVEQKFGLPFSSLEEKPVETVIGKIDQPVDLCGVKNEVYNGISRFLQVTGIFGNFRTCYT